MASDALHDLTLADVAAAIRDGALTSVEVTRHVLERIATLEPRLHAFAEVRADAALDEAQAADARRARGDAVGALHGVPVAVKDLCAMAGTATRAGGRFDTGFAPTETATVVARLQEFAAAPQPDRPVAIDATGVVGSALELVRAELGPATDKATSSGGVQPL